MQGPWSCLWSCFGCGHASVVVMLRLWSCFGCRSRLLARLCQCLLICVVCTSSDKDTLDSEFHAAGGKCGALKWRVLSLCISLVVCVCVRARQGRVACMLSLHAWCACARRSCAGGALVWLSAPGPGDARRYRGSIHLALESSLSDHPELDHQYHGIVSHHTAQISNLTKVTPGSPHHL